MKKRITRKKIKRHIRWEAVGKLFGFLLFVFLIFFFLFNIKTSRIVISGNSLVSDNDIITTSGFKNYPYLFRTSNATIRSRLLTIPEIEEVKVSKSLTGTLTLTITESKVLFYNRNNNKLVLSNHKEVDSTNLEGAPTLINYIPDTYYSKFIDKLSEIDSNVISLVSEIEYDPWVSNNVTIDETRFLLRMTDGNKVYINLINISKLNDYIEIYSSLEDKKGTLYLDSSGDKISFSSN